MQLLAARYVFFATAVAACGAVEFPEEDGVVVLTNETIDSALQQFPQLFIEFYAPWCGHCKKLAPEYAKAASMLAEEKSAIRLAKIDASLYRDVAQKYSVTGFPTIKLFIDKLESFVFKSAQRTAPVIVRWLKKRVAQHPFTFVHSVETAHWLISSNELVAFGFFKNQASKEMQAFTSNAKNNDNYEFLVTFNSQVFAEFSITSDSVVIFKQFDERRVDFKDEMTVESLEAFLKLHRHRLVTEHNEQTARKIYADNDSKKILWLFVDENSPDLNAHVDTLADVALAFRGQLLAAHSSDEQMMNRMGVRLADCPALVLMDFQNANKYRPAVGHQLTSSKIWLFVRSALDGKLKPFYKTQPLPADWNAAPVKILTATNFQEVALDTSKHVFVKFYTADEDFEPILDELAAQTANRDDVVVAKLDFRANDVPGGNVRFAPNCLLFPKGRGEAVSCRDAKDVDDFLQLTEEDGKETELKDDEGSRQVKKEL